MSTKDGITFHILSGLPLPTPLARDIMSCLMYAQAIDKVKITYMNKEDQNKFFLVARGSAEGIAHLEYSLKRPIKPYQDHFSINYTEDTMIPKDPNQKPHDWENLQAFELVIDYGGIAKN